MICPFCFVPVTSIGIPILGREQTIRCSGCDVPLGITVVARGEPNTEKLAQRRNNGHAKVVNRTVNLTPAVSDALTAIYSGNLVKCKPEEYQDVRYALQQQASKWIDGGDPMRAKLALMEVARLDREFDYRMAG